MKTWFLKNFVYRYHADWIDLYYNDRPIPEMREWFKENMTETNRGKILVMYYDQDQFMGAYPVINFCFKCEEDLMAFKLRWL